MSEADPAHRTEPRWRFGLWAGLAAGVFGVALGESSLFLAAIVGVAYAAYAAGSDPPQVALDVERTVEPASPDPGERVTVTVTVENLGDTPLVDLRIGDTPPSDVTVRSGATRHTTTLESGAVDSVSYAVRAKRGVSEWGPVVAVAGSATGAAATRTTYDVATTITCRQPVESTPPIEQTIPYAGRIETDSGGEGVEFYAVREHEAADPLSRIAWKHYAKTGELRTVQFRETRAARVVIVVDADSPQVRRPGEPDTLQLSAYAADRVARTLLGEGNQVGIAVLGEPGGYLAPDGGDDQAVAIRSFLARRFPSVNDIDANGAGDAGDGAGPTIGGEPGGAGPGRVRAGPGVSANGSGSRRWLERRLPDHAKVIYVSPLLSDRSVLDAKHLFVQDHGMTVLSPDVTHGDTLGGRVATVERRRRVADVERVDPGLRVVDWSVDEPLEAAIALAGERWSP